MPVAVPVPVPVAVPVPVPVPVAVPGPLAVPVVPNIKLINFSCSTRFTYLIFVSFHRLSDVSHSRPLNSPTIHLQQFPMLLGGGRRSELRTASLRAHSPYKVPRRPVYTPFQGKLYFTNNFLPSCLSLLSSSDMQKIGQISIPLVFSNKILAATVPVLARLCPTTYRARNSHTNIYKMLHTLKKGMFPKLLCHCCFWHPH